jgi:hypothetical protein
MASSNPTSLFSRKGIHRLECACGAYVYGTVACLEEHGLPSCACGERFVPVRRELAQILGVQCPAIVQFETAKALGLSDREAALWVEGRRLDAGLARRLAALRWR